MAKDLKAAIQPTNAASGTNTSASTSEPVDVEVSELDSDLELDELVPAYLKIKGKLYEIDPSLVETAPRKQKGPKARKANLAQPNQGPAVRKLLSQMQQINSDALFDEREAEAQWPAKRNQIAQDKANRRQVDDDRILTPNKLEESSGASATLKLASQPDQTDLPVDSVDTDEEADILGGMFSAIPDQPDSNQHESATGLAENIKLRDFGKSSGLTPRRLLEEAVRSRSVMRCLPCQYYTDMSQRPQCTSCL
jgi:ATP-dependent RNA helicase DHX29